MIADDRETFEPGEPTRLMSLGVKVPKGETGLMGSLYVHVDRDRRGRIQEVRISTPGKFRDSQMDAVMDAISHAVTEAVRGS